MHSARNRFFAGLMALSTLCWVGAVQAQTAADKSQLSGMANTAVAPANAMAKPPPANIFSMPAKQLFGGETTPAHLTPLALGSYAKGCLSGAQALPITGPSWQVMRTSRNRNWGTPQLIAFIERIANEAKQKDGWNGLLVGDMAQPRGGPMKTGHASHQIGLDADVWFTPMPNHVLSADERETMVPMNMIKSYKELNHSSWSESRAELLRTVATQPEVARIFVHPPIKAELCRWATGDRSWLAKVRPYFGHTYHFHVRLNCPAGMKACQSQWVPKPKDGTGCGEELAYWQSDALWNPKPRDPNLPNVKPKPPPPPLTLAGLPAECRAVIAAP